jgi:hypothetical protein
LKSSFERSMAARSASVRSSAGAVGAAHVLNDVGDSHDPLVIERRELGGDDGDGFGSGHIEKIARHRQICSP